VEFLGISARASKEELSTTDSGGMKIGFDLDGNSNMVSMTIEHAKANAGLWEFSYQEMPLRAAQISGQTEII
jgi:hypothetical protein